MSLDSLSLRPLSWKVLSGGFLRSDFPLRLERFLKLDFDWRLSDPNSDCIRGPLFGFPLSLNNTQVTIYI
jgi:hypothetical protein